MPCGCAERMRQHVLPLLGFVHLGDVWVNGEFPEPALREIPDVDVEQHHTRLTSHLTMAWVREKFSAWVAAGLGIGKSSTEQQWIWLLETFVLPDRGYTELEPKVWSMGARWHVGMPEPVTADMYLRVKDVLVSRMAVCYPAARFLELWNGHAPSELQMNEIQYHQYAAQWLRFCAEESSA